MSRIFNPKTGAALRAVLRVGILVALVVLVLAKVITADQLAAALAVLVPASAALDSITHKTEIGGTS